MGEPVGSAMRCLKVKVTQSCLTLCDPMDYTVHGILQARILEWVASALLQGIFPTQRSNPCVPHFRWLLYRLNHQGSTRILEWGAYPFSSGSFQPRNQTRVSCIAGRFFTSWATREAWAALISEALTGNEFFYPVSTSRRKRKRESSVGETKRSISAQSLWFIEKTSETCFQESSQPGVWT